MSERKLCQRLCIDDLCRNGNTLCGQDFCEGCGTAIAEFGLCHECREQQWEDEIEENARGAD